METLVREKPILFSGEMVRAVLDGRKTQTRRVVKPQSRIILHDNGQALTDSGWLPELDNPYGKPGDQLWVRETWATSLNSTTHTQGLTSHPKPRFSLIEFHKSIQA